MVYKISRGIARILWKCFFRLTVVGQEHIPTEGAYIIVANHTSFLDPLLICTIVPRVIHYITYAFFYYHPLMHWFCKRVYCIPVKKEGNDISALKKALRLLKQGELVGIFPEGQRSETGTLGRGSPGVALMALKAKVPILPVGIHGAYESFPKGAKFPKPAALSVTFGKPFFIQERKDPAGNGSFQEETTELIMIKIAEVCGQREEVAPNRRHIVEE